MKRSFLFAIALAACGSKPPPPPPPPPALDEQPSSAVSDGVCPETSCPLT
jgi:hypothetical protein